MKELCFIENKSIDLSELKIQYVPHIFNQELLASKNDPLSIIHSPHVQCLFAYLRGEDLWDTDYVKLLQYWNQIGYGSRKSKYIHNKVRSLIGLYNSIKKGYNKKCLIEILTCPFFETRYGCEYPFPRGYEIWHGHHRAACCVVLGISSVKCRVLKDNWCGSGKSKFDQKLRGIK